MLRRANEHETAAFFLVERTMQRARPRVGVLGLKAVEVPEGRIERNPLGLLRFRFDGKGSDFAPENGMTTRPVSEEEASLWNGLQRIVTTAKPVTDAEWNLLSMRLGARVLRRLPLGGVVTFVPNGTPPFKGSLDLSRPIVGPEPALPRLSAEELLRAIDLFLLETVHLAEAEPGPKVPWAPPLTTKREARQIVSTTLGHGRHHRAKSKWHRCPICHTPVVKGLFNPRIPYGNLRPGVGEIRDLRGGYLARLRETYLVADPNSLIAGTISEPPRRF